MAANEARHRQYLLEAIALARENVRRGGRPFGALVVKEGRIVGRGVNEIAATNDPTAHAELLAIREAGRTLATPKLEGCVVYASGHPCPMCFAAIDLAGIREVFLAYSNEDGAPYGLSTADVYAELAKPLDQRRVRRTHLPVRTEGEPDLYEAWKALRA